MEPKIIDIEGAIRQKFPAKAAKVPKWVFRFAKWLLYEKHLNYFITTYKDYEGVDFAEKMCEDMHVRFDIRGMENIPSEGRFVFTSNHPLGAFDGISYIAVFGHRFNGKFKVIVNDLLMHIHPLRPVFLPVNTLGKQKREDMETINAAYNDPDLQIMSFPAGFCSRWMKWKIQDVEWKKSVITQAIESQRDIIPMYFRGRNSITFYAVEWLRRVLGMKFNIGLLLLPRQLGHARNHKFGITIGKPIPWQTFTDKSKTPTQWAQWLREESYKLKG